MIRSANAFSQSLSIDLTRKTTENGNHLCTATALYRMLMTLLEAKNLFNSIVSTPGPKFTSVDIKDYFLCSAMDTNVASNTSIVMECRTDIQCFGAPWGPTMTLLVCHGSGFWYQVVQVEFC